MRSPRVTSLDGPWSLLPVEAFSHGFYPLDDQSWIAQELPAHWQQHPLLARYAGRMVYRRRFVAPQRAPDRRYWLRLNGTFYWSQPYFNGVDLGRHEGYFFPQEHEVTRWITDENTLLVEVECPEEHDKAGKRLITGVFSHWDCLDPETNPGGIWLPVELIDTGPVRIQRVLIETTSVTDSRAELRYRAVLDSERPLDVILRWTIAPRNFAGEVQSIEQRRTLPAGSHVTAGFLPVRDPQLWWTHDLGDPNCYTISLTIMFAGQVSDTLAQTFGIRTFELKNWIAWLNGVRLLLKGSNYGPGDTRIATMTSERYAADLRLAADAHMNILRVHAHIEHPAFYEAADMAGILLWQDFPLQWLYRREVLPEACRQAREMAHHLYNHPSVAIWCMHNEAIYTTDTTDLQPLTVAQVYWSVFVWNWNRDVLDTRIKRIVEEEDRTRPVVRSSGEYAVPLLRGGTDSHFYMGWYTPVYGPLRLWEPIARRFPDNIRFVTEFGAQSFPNLESCLKFMDADPAQIDWPYMVARHQFQDAVMEHNLPWRSAQGLGELVEMTQQYQAKINRFFIDRLRYYKYRPTGGIIPFMFHDPNPAISFSIIDYWRVPKMSYAAMQRAFSPQYAFTLLSQDFYAVGTAIELPLYVVNDAPRDVTVELEAVLTSPAGTLLARVHRAMTLPHDCMTLEFERLRLTPDAAGVYRLDIALRQQRGTVLAHAYEINVIARAPAPDGA